MKRKRCARWMRAPTTTSPSRFQSASAGARARALRRAWCCASLKSDRYDWHERRDRLAKRTASGLPRDHFTPIEYRLIAALARHAGGVATQRQLLREVWGPDHVDDAHYLRVYMKQLREKIEADPGDHATCSRRRASVIADCRGDAGREPGH